MLVTLIPSKNKSVILRAVPQQKKIPPERQHEKKVSLSRKPFKIQRLRLKWATHGKASKQKERDFKCSSPTKKDSYWKTKGKKKVSFSRKPFKIERLRLKWAIYFWACKQKELNFYCSASTKKDSSRKTKAKTSVIQLETF